ncbi:MAG: adenylosuccinate synthetase [Candidatus Cybelea sp.]
MKRIVVLSGAIGARKSTLARGLHQRYGATVARTRDLITARVPDVENDRERLQAEGERLDAESAGRWLAEDLSRNSYPSHTLLVIDAVRTLEQIEAIRDTFGRIVTHIHLVAPQDVRARRYLSRDRSRGEFETYEEATRNATERDVHRLAEHCDALIDTSLCTDEDVLVLAAARIGLYHTKTGACVDVIIGGQYGSEGKGNVASYLAPEYDYLVRVGGPNAGHKVISPPYTFRLLPSGTLHAPKAKLLIGAGATLQLDTLLKEITDCGVDPTRLYIDPNAMIIEESDKHIERKLMAAIGSTGQGGGYAAARRIMRGFLEGGRVRFANEAEELKPFLRPAVDLLEGAFGEGARVMLEGTQGAGLSLYHGRYPFVTSRDTTASATMAEAGIAPSRIRRIVMVCRTYPIRVGDPPNGTSGYMAQEISWEEISERSGIPIEELVGVEVGSVTHKPRRVGEFEWELFRKACSLNGPTDIALSFADYLNANNKNARRFEQLDQATIRFVEELERVGGAPVSLISTRFHARSIIDRRMW